MKKRVLLWIAGFIFAVTSLFAQDTSMGVVVAFKKGNSQELNKYLGEKMDLVTQNYSTSVDKQTAEGTFASSFNSNRVSDFNVNHEGKREESSFIVGTLTTANGNSRMDCFFRRVQNRHFINQIRIDKTNE